MKLIRNLGFIGITTLSSLFGNSYAIDDSSSRFLPICSIEKIGFEIPIPEVEHFYYNWHPKKGVLEVNDYPRAGWSFIVNADRDLDENGEEILPETVVVFSPNSVQKALGKIYDKFEKLGEVMPPNCGWIIEDDEKLLKIDNYPIENWETIIAKSKEEQYTINFSINENDAKILEDIFNRENDNYLRA
jgi:hypothetical protein